MTMIEGKVMLRAFIVWAWQNITFIVKNEVMRQSLTMLTFDSWRTTKRIFVI